jgi:hypothetical protein
MALRSSHVGRDDSVSTATRCRLDGPGIESWMGGGRNFPHPFRPALGPTQPPIQWVLALFPGAKVAEVKGRVQLYLNSPPCPHDML